MYYENPSRTEMGQKKKSSKISQKITAKYNKTHESKKDKFTKIKVTYTQIDLNQNNQLNDTQGEKKPVSLH